VFWPVFGVVAVSLILMNIVAFHGDEQHSPVAAARAARLSGITGLVLRRRGPRVPLAREPVPLLMLRGLARRASGCLPRCSLGQAGPANAGRCASASVACTCASARVSV
jgi:hypothetical protein